MKSYSTTLWVDHIDPPICHHTPLSDMCLMLRVPVGRRTADDNSIASAQVEHGDDGIGTYPWAKHPQNKTRSRTTVFWAEQRKLQAALQRGQVAKRLDCGGQTLLRGRRWKDLLHVDTGVMNVNKIETPLLLLLRCCCLAGVQGLCWPALTRACGVRPTHRRVDFCTSSLCCVCFWRASTGSTRRSYFWLA